MSSKIVIGQNHTFKKFDSNYSSVACEYTTPVRWCLCTCVLAVTVENVTRTFSTTASDPRYFHYTPCPICIMTIVKYYRNNGNILVADLQYNNCSLQDNKVRIRKPKGQQGDKTEKAFFYYDIPAASAKHIGLVLDLADLETNDPNVPVLRISLIFTGISGKRRKVEHEVMLGDLSPKDLAKKKTALEANYMHEARGVSQLILHSAAENIKSGDSRQTRIDLVEGKSELQKLMESYGQMAQEEEVNLEIVNYAGSLMKNLESLLDCIDTGKEDDTDGDGKNWMKIKAISSAITRESPTLSDTMQDADLLCPLPNVSHVESPLIREQMERVYKKQGVRRTQFVEFDNVVNELSASFRQAPLM